MHLTADAKVNIDAVLEQYVNGEKSIPGLVYKAVDKHGNIVYEGCRGVESLEDASKKVRSFNSNTLDTSLPDGKLPVDSRFHYLPCELHEVNHDDSVLAAGRARAGVSG